MTGTIANTITIQKSGAGANPVFTAYTGTVATPSVIAMVFSSLQVVIMLPLMVSIYRKLQEIQLPLP
ncbi:MAG: hypothetical protein IPG39_17275 [Bacteroidetes bacterium]|nr:hypothetical protein [Bacteroidota bacterium]